VKALRIIDAIRACGVILSIDGAVAVGFAAGPGVLEVQRHAPHSAASNPVARRALKLARAA
jgi:hypothetical protein